MKKTLCLLMIAVLMIGSLVGCGKSNSHHDTKENNILPPENLEENRDPSIIGGNASSISGIDAAKLLLAEERLNEKLLKNEGDIFELSPVVRMHEQ